MKPRERGSSPLARGLPERPARPRAAVRIIPARAGFTQGYRGEECRGADHPRSRGVYGWWIIRGVAGEGSSPLARGLHTLCGIGVGAPRIIPARAGFTSWATTTSRWREDHPRSRGVYSAPDNAARSAEGSSPLARGLLEARDRHGREEGIIPARAGFTHSTPSGPVALTDHPRSRGVYCFLWVAGVGEAGSSPLARGLPRKRDHELQEPGIIPARAGFTEELAGQPVRLADHPRSRGVYGDARGAPRALRGSSPLARGLREYVRTDVSIVGIIPARAGFTL